MPSPRLRFSVPIMRVGCNWSAAPVLHGGLVVLGGGDADGFDEVRAPAEAPVLQGIDLGTGAIRFTFSEEVTLGALEASEPCLVGGDGEVLFAAAIARQFEGTKLVVVDAGGRLRREWLLGDGWPFVAYDAGLKLITAVTSRRAGEIVATWAHRQVREWGTAVFRIDAPEHAWTSDERCVGCARGVAVGVALPAHAPVLVGRDLDDGRELYRVPLGEEAVAALVTREVVLVEDRAAQYAAYAAREVELTELAVTERLDMDDALERMEAHPGVPATLRVLSAGTGEEQLRHELAGDIVHVSEVRIGAAVVASTPDGRGECLVLNRAGEAVARFPAPGRRLDRAWKLMENRAPRVLGMTGRTVLYAAGGTLFGLDAAIGERRWEMALPDEAAGFHPQIRERHLAKANVACDGDVLVLRGTTQLWVYDLARV